MPVLEQIGVEAVVAGLSSFMGDMKKVDSTIQGLIPGTKLLDNAFGFLGDTVSGFANFALNTLAHALGELVADAVEFVIQKLGELVESTIEAGAEFQTLELRLSTLNFNTLTQSGMEYNKATTESIRLTREQLDWLQKLAVATPYDAQDIANTYTLARSYGYLDEEARSLTESIINFASGMGLGSVEIERIIINFGQMVQQGKVTQREMNDLARGSFVPVNDILEQMKKNLGMSTEELTKFRQTAESVPEFMKAFQQLVEERFSGAAEKMARTFQGATANLKDFIKSIGGMNIIKPILDAVGSRIADFITALTKEGNWEKITGAAKRVGNALYLITTTLLGIMPKADTVANVIIKGLDKIANWLYFNYPKIADFILELRSWIYNKLIPAIQEVWKWLFGSGEEEGALQRFGQWIQEKLLPVFDKVSNWVQTTLIPFLQNDLPPLLAAILPLLEEIGSVILTAFGGEGDDQGRKDFSTWIHEDLIPGIEKLTTFIRENKDEIALWLDRLVTATIQLAIFAGIVAWVITLVMNITAAFLDWLIVSGNWVNILYVIAIAAGLVAAAMNGILIPVLALILVVGLLYLGFVTLKAFWDQFVESFKDGWSDLADAAAEDVMKIQEAFKNGDWVGVGKAIIEGIVRGIQNFAVLVVEAAQDAAISALQAITDIIGFGPPGMVPSSSATPSTTNSSTTNTNNYNLTVNSSANREPIVQDFNMLQSIASPGR